MRLSVLVLVAGVVSQLTDSVAAQRSPNDPTFDVASIKPNAQGYIDLGNGLRLLRGETRCQATDTAAIPGDPLPPASPGSCVIRNSTVEEIINFAHDLRFGPNRAVLNQMITGGPSWVETAAFDIDAKAATPFVTVQQMRGMLRTLIAERFRLTFHREARQINGLALVIDKGGHKLKSGDPGGKPGFVAAPVVRGQNVPILTIVNLLSQRLGRPVADKTGLTGVFDFTLTWTPDPTDLGPGGRPAEAAPAAQDKGALVTALQEQLGLRLETAQIAVNAFVIDSVEHPTPN